MMDYEFLKLIDFYKEEDRFHKAKLYFGDISLTDYWGDDWNDVPYEHNAGEVYDEFVDYVKEVRLYEEGSSLLLQPSDIPDPNTEWCKDDFKQGLTPCLLVVPSEVVEIYENSRFYDYPTYTQALGHPKVRKIYYGDSYIQIMNTLYL